MMTKIVLVFFTLLTGMALFLTYDGSTLQGISTHAPKQIRSTHSGSWYSSSGGGFSSGK